MGFVTQNSLGISPVQAPIAAEMLRLRCETAIKPQHFRNNEHEPPWPDPPRSFPDPRPRHGGRPPHARTLGCSKFDLCAARNFVGR